MYRNTFLLLKINKLINKINKINVTGIMRKSKLLENLWTYLFISTYFARIFGMRFLASNVIEHSRDDSTGALKKSKLNKTQVLTFAKSYCER